jgi:hypothetical protein
MWGANRSAAAKTEAKVGAGTASAADRSCSGVEPVSFGLTVNLPSTAMCTPSMPAGQHIRNFLADMQLFY